MKPTIICLTPVRNNGSLLDRFLSSASLWADHIIICDQMSTDNSRDIAKKYSKVILIDNPSLEYNEPERAKLLIEAARKIHGNRLLITLDADEIFTPNVLTSSEWKTVLNSKPGTIFKFQWANFKPDLLNMWYGHYFPWGYMDDGYEHLSSNKIHVSRIPMPPSHDIVILNQIKVIHFQFTDWMKMQSKHCWYQCYETLIFPKKSAIDIFRQYHHMYAIPKHQIIPIPQNWIDDYNKLGIDITSVYIETINWFDQQCFNLIEEHGAIRFKKLNIWNENWFEKAIKNGKANPDLFKDPRSQFDIRIQRWLQLTQNKLDKRIFRRIDRLLKSVLKY